ncbi:type I secretion C-terminal target domain-containing protein [Mesorhizobium sp. BR1-1-13]|uniref:beta strand repeat-containing protein n=1 Tax=Mesorhizobium sp. BR1-1-13 TaxID=2876656 RepID=UPI001CD121CA|nr:type I secretion C-terminal target domain-containing protein [Mesorhizobium sp. BR1-1-13]MBZ9944503.1 type I secretion C-terminal target domain-containing protein [Mesorhizobium sp. BR1-1-13]
MTAAIYIATKSDGTQHTYWVFDPDGNPYSGDEKIIRGGLPHLNSSDYVIEIDRDIADSRDALDGDDPYSNRYYTTVTSGSLLIVQAVWDDMVSAATALGTSISDPDYAGQSVTKLAEDTYWIPAPDCHTLTSTLGDAGGIDTLANLPKIGGDVGSGERTSEWHYPGINARLISTGDSTVALNPEIKAYFDQGGADNYTLDPSTLGLGQTINIFEDSDTGTVDKITLLNVDPADVHVVRGPNGYLDIFIEGRNTPIVTIPGQFDGSGVPKINTLIVEPPVGSPTSVPLVDPDNIPLYTPVPLPALISGEIQPAFTSAISASSPLVIDLSSAHTGVTLTSWNASTTETFFDLNDNGFAVQTAWVSGDSGLLARDLNSNGMIDSSAELFGSPTVDGFAKLAALDSNHDLRIDNNDADWSTLVVWTDDNGDAVTQSGELHSLTSLGIANIDLAGVASSTSTISGNPISHTSKVTFTGGATATIADAWFVHDNTNSYYAGDYTLDVETLFLPTLRGYGKIPDLTIAMSQDSDLKDLVANFVAGFSLDSFVDSTNLKSDIEEILLKWAGVDGIDPDSRGNYFDARKLEFLESILGTDFYQIKLHTPDPTPGAVLSLTPAYSAAVDMFAADLMVQAGGFALFSAPVTYNVATGEIEGTAVLSSDALDYLTTIAPAPGADNNAFWELILRFIDRVEGIDNLTITETGWLEDALADTDVNLSINTIRHIIDPTFGVYNSISGTNGDDTLNGGLDKDEIVAIGGNDTVHGNGGNDIIDGGLGNNTLYGDAGNDDITASSGNDTIYGGDGDDIIHAYQGTNIIGGGTGGNTLAAGSDGDTYIYEGGQDLIIDQGGTDHITLPSGITLGNLSFARVSSQGSITTFNDLLISIDGIAAIQVQTNFSGSSLSYGNIESIVFADTSTLNLTTITTPDIYLTGGNDSFGLSNSASYTVYGNEGNDSITTGGAGAHTIDGGLGNDAMAGGSGNDTYLASEGIDTITDTFGGSDTIIIPAEYNLSDITFYRVNNASGPTSNLGILIADFGEIIISGQFLNSTAAVENLYFLSDSSSVSLTNLSITTLGTSGNNNLTVPTVNAGTNDIFDGREGDDTMAGGSGDDTYIFSAGHDTINDSAGTDTIRVRESYAPSDVTIVFVQSGSSDKHLQLTDPDGNTILVYNHTNAAGTSVEHVVFGDTTVWTLSTMEIETHGTSGNDSYLFGHDIGDASSNDTIYGYAGNDVLKGENGDDLLYGGDGTDTIYAMTGYDIAHGDDGNDTITGDSHATLYGDAGDDYLGNGAASGSAASTLVTMYGGDGADSLHGGYGQTIMKGGAGADTLVGFSSGKDTFSFDSSAFGAVDTISSFQTAGANPDKIDISDILDGYYHPGTDVITNFVQITTNGSNSKLYVDATGSATFGTAQHIASIQGVTGLTDEEALVTAGTLLAA